MPTDAEELTAELQAHQLSIVAGTIFDDLVSEENFAHILDLTHQICRHLSQIPCAQTEEDSGGSSPYLSSPYLVLIDFGCPERARYAGLSDKAPCLEAERWQGLADHIKQISEVAWNEYGVRPVIHPHAGGYIEFADEITRILDDVPYEVAGLCLDTGHLYYSGMEPVSWLARYEERLDYVHFKDVNAEVHERVLAQEVDFFTACAQGVMCPIGQGAIDYPAVKQQLDKMDYQGWITIEQERDPRDVAGSLQDVAASLHYLRSVGF